MSIPYHKTSFLLTDTNGNPLTIALSPQTTFVLERYDIYRMTNSAIHALKEKVNQSLKEYILRKKYFTPEQVEQKEIEFSTNVYYFNQSHADYSVDAIFPNQETEKGFFAQLFSDSDSIHKEELTNPQEFWGKDMPHFAGTKISIENVGTFFVMQDPQAVSDAFNQAGQAASIDLNGPENFWNKRSEEAHQPFYDRLTSESYQTLDKLYGGEPQ